MSITYSPSNGSNVYRCDPDGTVSLVAGGGGPLNAQYMSDAIPALGAGIRNVSALAVAPDGTIYLGVDDGLDAKFLHRIAADVPGESASELSVPSDDGSEVYYFDLGGRHLRTRDALTGSVRHSFLYDQSGRLTTIRDVNGDATTIERSGSQVTIVTPYGRRTVLETDNNGWLESITNPAQETVQLNPSAAGLLLGITDANQHSSAYTYALDGRLDHATDALDVERRLEEDPDSAGITRVVERRSGAGRIFHHYVTERYDGTLRRGVKDPRQRISWYADSVNASLNWLAPDGSTVRDSLTREPRFSFFAPVSGLVTERLPNSGMARTTSVVRPTKAEDFNPPFKHGEWQERDSVNGRAARVTTFNSATGLLQVQSPAGRVTTVTVDSAGRPLTANLPGVTPQLVFSHDGPHKELTQVTQGGRTWRMGYDDGGRLAWLVDPSADTTRLEFDLADRLTVLTQPGGIRTEFGYDSTGNLTSLTPPGRTAHAFDRNAVNLVEAYRPPAAGLPVSATQYEYDGDRALTRLERPDGRTVEVGYDAAGALESITAPDDSVMVEYWGTGQVKRIAISAGVELTYGSEDYDGPLLLKETWASPVARYVQHGYNRDFQVATQNVNGQQPVAFEYDADGLLTKAGDLTVARVEASGQVDSTQLAYVTSRQDYSGYGELANLAYRYDENLLFHQSLARDALGRITALREQAFGTDTLYGYRYDAAGRLYAVTTNGDTTARYRYDANGNRTWAWFRNGDEITAEYDAQDRLTYVDTTGRGRSWYEYTAAGELSRVVSGTDTTRYTYDVLGNLRQVVANGDTIEYLVDGRNRRVGRKVNGVLVQGWLYQNGLNPVAELDGAGNVVARYVYGTRGHVPEYVVKGGTTYRLVTDQLGSVRAVVNDSTGAVAEQINYDAWGQVKRDTDPGFVTLGYAGGLRDAATGLVRFGARDYDPSVGRWTCKDPIGFGGGDGNLYAYVLDDPVDATDATGDATAEARRRVPRWLPLPPSFRKDAEDAFNAGEKASQKFGSDDPRRNAVEHATATHYLACRYGRAVAMIAGYEYEWFHPDWRSWMKDPAAQAKDTVHDWLNDWEGSDPSRSVDHLVHDGKLWGPDLRRLPPSRGPM